MSTAHRPTFHNAIGGTNQGGNLIVGYTQKVCARDLPGHTQLKTRQIRPPPLYSDATAAAPAAPGQLPEAERKAALRKQLEQRERAHQVTKLREASQRNQPLEAIKFQSEQESAATTTVVNKVAGALLPDQEANPFPEDEDDEGPANRALPSQPSSAAAQAPFENGDESDESDGEEELLMRELEKIKREREEEEQKRQMEELEKKEREDKARVLTANPLLMLDEVDRDLKRRWDDDVIFKNQAKDLPKPKKRFINDTVRSDFHKKFLARYIH